LCNKKVMQSRLMASVPKRPSQSQS